MSEASHSRLSYIPPRPRQIVVPLAVLGMLLLPSAANGQLFDPGGVDLQTVSQARRAWKIFGRVTTLGGEPIHKAKVTVDTAAGKPEVVETNAKGEFSTEVLLATTQYEGLHVRVAASKEGYFTAHESEDFTAKDKVTREILVVLREDSANSELLSPQALVSSLEERFRAPAVRAQVPGPAIKDFDKGVEKLFREGLPLEAISSLGKSVSKAPDCLNCRLLLCLANLAGNAIATANRLQGEIDKLTASGNMPQERATLLYIAGVVETWRNQNENAVGFFQKALEIHPTDPATLQELGRTLLLQKNWEAADAYLEKATLAGASTEVHLLRARALLELSDLDNADAEMKAYVGNQPIRSLPLAVRLTYLDLQQRLQVRSLANVKSVVNQPLPELIKVMPELKGLEASASQDELPAILQKVGGKVEAFFRDFSNTISEEAIQVEHLGAKGKVTGIQTEKDNYLLLAKPEKWGLGLTEYRATPEGQTIQLKEPEAGSMRTKGFASASLVFHPLCQGDVRFRYLGRQKTDAQELFVIAFAQQPEKAKMVGLAIVNGVAEPALVQGMAWADAKDYQIVRMRTDLLRPLSKIRLSRQTTDIRYAEVQFKDAPGGLWLPQVVTVTVEWKGKTFRNSHTYSNFKRFNVATEERRKGG